MVITIIQWEKYNDKRGQKRNWWFKVSDDIFDDPKMQGLTNGGWKLFFWLLTRASKSNNASINFGATTEQVWCKSRLSLKQVSITRAINYMESQGIISVTRCENAISREDKSREEEIRVEARGSKPRSPPVEKSESILVWEAYYDAYRNRYGQEPVRNAKVNGIISQLVARLGKEAKQVVKFYVYHNESFYLKKVHDIGLCLSDAEALRTQMLRGKQVTSSDIRAFEKVDSLRAQKERLGV